MVAGAVVRTGVFIERNQQSEWSITARQSG
jgi:hypothetical protein